MNIIVSVVSDKSNNSKAVMATAIEEGLKERGFNNVSIGCHEENIGSDIVDLEEDTGHIQVI